MNSSLRYTILERDGFVCRYCGHADEKHLTIDHVIPTSRGGHPSKKANLVSACFKCNQRKANQTPEEAGMPILADGFKYTPPGKLDDGVEVVNVLVVVNQGYGRKRRKKKERRRRKAIIKYWQDHGHLPEDLTVFGY
jgi:hypothetical protein